jgi:N-acetylmuramoyl-L-alanine amidase
LRINYKYIQAKNYKKFNGPNRSIKSIILHSTDGHEQGDVATLVGGGEHGVSVHWYVTKDGRYYHFVQDNDIAYHAGVVDSPEHSNTYSLGIEQEHLDGEETWPDAQIKATAALVAFLYQHHNLTDLACPVLSHASVAFPKGRKEDPLNFPWTSFSTYFHTYMNGPINAEESD